MMFTNLKFPDSFINYSISHFVTSLRSQNPRLQAQLPTANKNAVHRVVLPFKDQKSADTVKRQLLTINESMSHESMSQ